MNRFFAAIRHGIKEFIISLIPSNPQRVVFCNFGGRGFGDQCGAIAGVLLNSGRKLDLVWLVKDMSLPVPQGIRKVLIGPFRMPLALSTAKVVIANTKQHLVYRKRKGAFYIQTWHGDLALKLIEAECEETLAKAFPNYVRRSKEDSKRTDYVLSGSKFFSELVRNHFWYPQSCKVFECGVPRQDVFFNYDKEVIDQYKIDLAGGSNIRLITFAPTFRDSGDDGRHTIEPNAVLDALETKTGKKWKMVVRFHPEARFRARSAFKYGDRLIDGTAIDDQQKLWLVSDAMITDYSSTMAEMMILKRPVFLYIPDLEQYRSSDRPLRDLYFRLPFDFCHSMGELIAAIGDFDMEKYLVKLDHFMKHEYGYIGDGHASERVAGLILEMISGKRCV